VSSRAEREAQGRRGETLAAWYLRLTGWHILARRVKTTRGEIDLIARRGKVVAFIEVKWRATARDRDLALDTYRLRRVAEAAEAVGHRYTRDGDDMRIDAILLAPRRWPHHLVNVWQP
jgi:putative endonuclease